MRSGIYIVQLLNQEAMPVTRDSRYVETCAKVSSKNIKVGKTKDFFIRQNNYWKDFDRENVIFQPLVELEDIVAGERAILRELKKYRINGPKGRKLEWLEGIDFEIAVQIVFEVLDKQEIYYKSLILIARNNGAYSTE